MNIHKSFLIRRLLAFRLNWVELSQNLRRQTKQSNPKKPANTARRKANKAASASRKQNRRKP